jgi:hypothetical protein
LSDQHYDPVYPATSSSLTESQQPSPELLAKKEQEASDDAKQALTMSLIGLALVFVGFILGVIAYRKASSATRTIDQYGVAKNKRGIATAAKVIGILDIVVWLAVVAIQVALR